MYGLYQGIIGGPNIRKRAFTSSNIYAALKANATEFINSNRGAITEDKDSFRVSSLYQRNKHYFPSFEDDLRKHLQAYLTGDLVESLELAHNITPDIDNWRVNDVYGTFRNFGAGVNDNSAAFSGNKYEDFVVVKDGGLFSKEQIELLMELNDKRLENAGSVTVTDLENKE